MFSTAVAQGSLDEQMEYGELALTTPAIPQFYQEPPKVIKLVGSGSIQTKQQLLSPKALHHRRIHRWNLWYNPTEGRLFIYYEDVDSNQWVDASPDDYVLTHCLI